MTPDQVGPALTALKAARGLTWREVGELIGTTGEYARKVAGGKGGGAYVRQVAELTTKGATTPAARRHDREGNLAMVRGKRGAPSVRPVQQAAEVARHRLLGQRGRMVVVEVVPFPYGTRSRKAQEAAREAREPAKAALQAAVRSAARGRRHVSFQVGHGLEKGEPIAFSVIGGTAGYRASDVLRRARNEGNDLLAWLGDDDRLAADDQDGELQKLVAPRYGNPGGAVDDEADEWGVVQVEVIVRG